MFKFSGLAACLMALLYLSGAHLMLVQGVAWTNMLVDYSQDGGWLRGVEKTFDGDHPCRMCVRVEQERSEKPAVAIEIKFSDLKAASIRQQAWVQSRIPDARQTFIRMDTAMPDLLQEAPPLQPPRLS